MSPPTRAPLDELSLLRAENERLRELLTVERPTSTELSHIAAGTWPGVQVGA